LNEKDDLPMRVATFRFGVIADFVTGTRFAYGEKERLLTEKADRAYLVLRCGPNETGRCELSGTVEAA
jgi:hypothetical protein